MSDQRIENDVHPLVVVIVVEGKNLVVQNVVEVIAVGAVASFRGEMGGRFRNHGSSFLRPLANSQIQPSLVETEMEPFMAADMPEVPDASRVTTGSLEPYVGAVFQVAAQAQSS